MHRRLFALVTAGILAAPLAAAVPLAAQAAPSPTGLTARNVPVCQTPQNTLTARCHAIRHELVDGSGKPVSPNATIPTGYTPAQLQGAYNLAGASSTYGAGQTIAIVDAYDNPNAAADLAKYRSTMQPLLPLMSTCVVSTGKVSSTTGPCFLKVNQNGVAGSYPQADGGWAQEISLDLDMASAICPKCNILLVEASSASFTDLGTSVMTAAGLSPAAISNSYGSSRDVSDASYGTYYNHPGIAVTASTGDSGYGVGYPATSQYTVAVGGTTLSPDNSLTNLRGWSESAWSGAGSGCSTYQTQPKWQQSYGLSACGTKRAIADVSADADPNTGVAVYDSYSYQGLSGWLQFGGTSVSSPIIASVYTLAKSAGATWPGINPASVLYTNSLKLYDATGGSNGRCHPSVLCNGGTGWDGPTGLGTPNGLAAFGGSSGGGTATTPTAGFISSCTNLACSFTDTSTDIVGSITGWSWTFGDGGTSTERSPSHAYGSGGNYAVTLTVTDSGNQTSSVSHNVTVSAGSGTVPVITGTSCSGGATCTFTATGSDPLTWSFGATGSPVSTTYTAPGGYTVIVSNTAGSVSTSVSCVWNGHGRNKTLACS